MQERHGNEPLWQTVDRMLDELLRLRTEAEGAMQKAEEARHRTVRRRVGGPSGPLLQLSLGGLA
jgi:hypothetical protein